MNIKFSNNGVTLIAGINGELDHHSAEYLKQKLDSEILKSTTKNLILDFSNVGFMDSSGIGIVIGRYKMLEKLNGTLAVINLTPQVKKIFDMAGLFKIISVYDSVDDALNKM